MFWSNVTRLVQSDPRQYVPPGRMVQEGLTGLLVRWRRALSYVHTPLGHLPRILSSSQIVKFGQIHMYDEVSRTFTQLTCPIPPHHLAIFSAPWWIAKLPNLAKYEETSCTFTQLTIPWPTLGMPHLAMSNALCQIAKLPNWVKYIYVVRSHNWQLPSLPTNYKSMHHRLRRFSAW